MQEWITTKELSEIIGISSRAIRKSASEKKYISRKICSKYEIFIPSLSDDIQKKIQEYYSNQMPKLDDIQYTEEEKKLALSKFNLIMEWRKFLINYKGTKISSIKDFMLIHNARQEKGNVFVKINKAGSATIMRWDKKLKENNDNWQALLSKHAAYSKGTSLSKQEQEIFLKFLLHPNRTNIGKAIKLTKFMLKEQGIKSSCSDMAYRRFAKKYIEEHYDVWVFSREGSKALKDKVLPYIQRDVSNLEVGDVIVGDGHRLSFQVINPFDGKPVRPMLTAYQDWKSGALIGFEIMLEENTQCIASALRNSTINLGKIPKYIYQDNGKAFKSKYFTEKETCIEGLFIKLGITPIYALPYNAKAKVIERFFKEMQDSFERLLPSFSGSCIDNKPAYMKRNEKFHKEIHNEYIPTIEEVITLINKWLCFHYSQPCPNTENKTIGEVLDEGRGLGVDISELDDLMMAAEIKNIGRNGIRFLKSDYYDECLYGLRTKVIIKYSLFDLSQVKVFTPQGKFLCTAKRLEPIDPVVNYTGSAKDIEEFKQRIKQQKQLELQTAKAYIAQMKKEKAYLPAMQDNYNELGYFEEETKYIEAFKQAEKIEDEEPVFHNRYERYEYLCKKSHLNNDEIQWINNYEKTEEYGLIYGITGE